MTSSADSVANALWTATALEPAPDADRFEANADVDLAVVGGGFTGASAALAGAEAGARVALIEARAIGWGGSGRNGGQVIPGLKLDPSEILSTFGEERGARLADEVGAVADNVFALIERHRIDCEPRRGGWVQAAPNETAAARVLRRGEEWRARGAPTERLDAEQLARLTGAHGYVGGWIDRRAGTLHPLSYVRGLARAAQRAGARLHEGVTATALRRDGEGWRVATTKGEIRAHKVVVGPNGYADGLVPGLAQSLICVQSALIATEPLAPELRDRIMPAGVCLSETRRLAFYVRQSPDGRLLFGGRGAIGDAQNDAFFAALSAAMRRMFPEAGASQIAYRWSGQVAFTPDGMPRIHEPEPGLLIGAGYNGRGVAMATRMGQWLAARALDGAEPPLPITPIAPIPWLGLRRPAIQIGIAWAWLRDRLGLPA